MYNYQKIHVNIFIKRQKRWGWVGVFGGVGEDGGLCQISIHKSLAILFILYVFYRPMYMYNKDSWADTRKWIYWKNIIKWSIENKLTGIIILVRFHEGLSMKKVTVFTLMVLCGDFYFVDFLYFKNTHLLNKDIYQYLWIMIFYISLLCVHMFKNSTENSKILNWWMTSNTVWLIVWI